MALPSPFDSENDYQKCGMIRHMPWHLSTWTRSRFLNVNWGAAAVLLGLLALSSGGCSSNKNPAVPNDGSSTESAESVPVDSTALQSNQGAVSGRPSVVVTYSILGDMVRSVLGDAADVQVLIPNGQDPHDFSPSARDLQRLRSAKLVVANGLGLEEGLVDSMQENERAGVATFYASDHVTLRSSAEAGGGETAGADANHAGDDHHSDHEGGIDPHLWTDPLTLRELVGPLAKAFQSASGVEVTASAQAVEQSLTSLDSEVRSIMAPLGADGCRLVTGHDSLGYFASRYSCRVVGAIVPSLSSSAEASAKDLAGLRDAVRSESVRAIFTEMGTSKEVAKKVADETGAQSVPLVTHALPDKGGYNEFVLDLARTIATALQQPVG